MRTYNLAASENPLIPNGTVIVELVIFVIVLVIMWKVILPPLNNALKRRHDMVSQTLDDNRKATEALQAAESRYHEALAEARAESGKIREEAREEGRKVLEEMRSRATAEAEQIRQRGQEQLDAARDSVVAELRDEVTGLSQRMASRIVGTEIGDGSGGGARS